MLSPIMNIIADMKTIKLLRSMESNLQFALFWKKISACHDRSFPEDQVTLPSIEEEETAYFCGRGWRLSVKHSNYTSRVIRMATGYQYSQLGPLIYFAGYSHLVVFKMDLVPAAPCCPLSESIKFRAAQYHDRLINQPIIFWHPKLVLCFDYNRVA